MSFRPGDFALPKSISGQCCRLFLPWFRIEYLPPSETHRRSHHLPNDFRLLGMPQRAHRNGRQWVRLQDDAIAIDTAPGTDKPIAGLDEIDGTLELRPPKTLRNPILGFVDLNETPRRKNRVHSEVSFSDITVGIPVVGQCGKIGECDHPPPFNLTGPLTWFADADAL